VLLYSEERVEFLRLIYLLLCFIFCFCFDALSGDYRSCAYRGTGLAGFPKVPRHSHYPGQQCEFYIRDQKLLEKYDFFAEENKKLKLEIEQLKKELDRLKGKGYARSESGQNGKPSGPTVFICESIRPGVKIELYPKKKFRVIQGPTASVTEQGELLRTSVIDKNMKLEIPIGSELYINDNLSGESKSIIMTHPIMIIRDNNPAASELTITQQSDDGKTLIATMSFPYGGTGISLQIK
jgi:hypothetical protein